MRLNDYSNVRLKESLRSHLLSKNESIFSNLNSNLRILKGMHDVICLMHRDVVLATAASDEDADFRYYYLDNPEICEYPLEKDIYDLLIKNLYILRPSIPTVEKAV